MKVNTQTSSFGSPGRSNHDSTSFYNLNLYNDIKKNNTDNISYKENYLPDNLKNTIINDSSEDMSSIPDCSVHLMITSPPYNVSKEYDENLSLSEYLSLIERVLKETYRVIVDGGRICINVANLGRKPYLPISDLISKIAIDIGLNMRGEIIWNKASSASPSCAWGSWQSASNPVLRDIHEYILIFSKGNYKRNRNKDVRSIKRDSILREQFIEWTKSIWTINAVSAKRIGHPAPFPEELPYRLIQLYSFETDIILDPFIGSGTTAIAALKSNRNFIGFETNSEYIELANKRINKATNQLSLDI